MGYELRRQVRDAMPPGVLTSTERLVVLELADVCGDKTREGWPTAEWLAEKCDIAPDKVGEYFTSVAKKWIELRVVLGTGRTGRPFFSKPGKKVTYRFPPLGQPAEKVPENRGAEDPGNRGPQVPENRGGRTPKTGHLSTPETGDPNPQRTTQLQPSPPYPPAASLTVVVGEIVEEGEERFIEERIETLVADAARLAADRRWQPAKIRPHVVAALDLVEHNLDALAELVRKTAADRDSRSPSRISNPGNPYLRPVKNALLIARMDAIPAPVVEVPPGAHPFQRACDSDRCVCDWPEPHKRHRDAAGALLKMNDPRLEISA